MEPYWLPFYANTFNNSCDSISSKVTLAESDSFI